MSLSSLSRPSGASGNDVHLSVVLPVRDGEMFLGDQLRALAAQRCTFAWELIVVDNGSSDRSAQIAREFSGSLPGLQVLSEPRPGKPYALNRGIEATRGALLVLVDADDEVEEGYLEAMANALRHHDLVSARVDTTRLNPSWLHEELLPGDRLVRYLDFQIYIPGSLIGIRRETFEHIGPFDPAQAGGEDVNFVWRAQLLGVDTGLAPGAVLQFRRPLRPLDAFRKARGYGRSHVRLYVKYGALGQPRRSTRRTLLHVKWMVGELIRRKPHWQWRFAWDVGAIEGRLEESLRQRVWYP